MADIQITQVGWQGSGSKHRDITHLGDFDRMYPRWDVICWIEDGETTFYTMIRGKRADIRVREENGFRYVQAVADGDWSDDLLALSGNTQG